MSQRASGFERKDRDAYETPEWVTRALVPHLPLASRPMTIWEPACGSGKMQRALEAMGHKVWGTDIASGTNFLTAMKVVDFDAIITNPPYAAATEFINHALSTGVLTVAMLLRTDFDHAATRRPLFANCRQFAKKLVLTRRIQWFDDSEGSPSFNHAWFLWDWRHEGPPTIAYGP